MADSVNEVPELLSDETPDVPIEEPDFTDWWKKPGVTPPAICHLNSKTREFWGLGVADPSPLEPGIWLIPAHSTLIPPPENQEGKVAICTPDNLSWVYEWDFRGKTLYHKVTGESIVWGVLGEIPEDYTTVAPAGEGPEIWEEETGEWVPDEAALAREALINASKRKQLSTQYATTQIATLQDAVDLEMATDEEAAALLAWKRFRVYLSRVDVSTVAPAADAWPVSPAETSLRSWLTGQGVTF